MDKEQIRQFADRIYRDMAGAMAVGMAYLGAATGLFRSMAERGPMTAAEVTEESGLQPRYVEEWLRGMASAGYLVHETSTDTYRLPAEHSYLLASEGTDHFMGGLFHFVPVLLSVAPQVAESFRNGGGVDFGAFGPAAVEALDMINAGQYEQRFGSYWLGKLPDVVSQLERGGRVLDVGCGVGRVATAIARKFPNCEVVGLDPDGQSIAWAERHARAAGARVRFLATTTATIERGDGFDLITACDCVHDFARPRTTLREMRSLLKPGGTLFVVEPRAGDTIAENMHPIGTMYYGFSLFHCMTQSLAAGGEGLGTCMGPSRTEALLREAGFDDVRQVDIRSQTNLFYAARA